MKNGLQLILSLAVIATLTGCSTTYMVDRRRDAADILTLGVGLGLGAKVRVGPLQTGLLFESDMAALRGGEFVNYKEGAYNEEFLFTGMEIFAPEEFKPPYPQRGKTFKAYGGLSWIPFVHLVNEETEMHCYSYYTQIELVGALYGSVRVGVNPGELVDFVLGWTTIDIFNDDVETKKTKETK
jgi:hypothetical protein